ncbi:MAG: phosphomannomutase/phosphoglucomutase [Pseudomonadota bacterium]
MDTSITNVIQRDTLLPSKVFRAYDIRGAYPNDLHEAGVYQLGRSFGTETQERGSKTVVVGRDARLSGPTLKNALVQGLRDSGCDVIDIGAVPTPLLYFACAHLKVPAGIMITGSHNPPQDNGFKMVLNFQALDSETILSLQARAQAKRWLHGQGQYCEQVMDAVYQDILVKDIHLKRPLRVVIDAGNGAAGPLALNTLMALGVHTIPLYCEPDGRFPNHHPDPAKPENLKDLIARVHAEQADCGLAFDGDGDRLGVVTPKGEIIWADRLLILFAESILRQHAGGTVVFDIKSTRDLVSVIEAHHGTPVLCRTGHSFIKAKMRECNALLGGEMSGHFFFKDRWYGFDDALYAGCRLLELLSNVSDVSAYFEALPKRFSTPELHIPVADELKFQVVADYIQHGQFEGAKTILVDGLRVEYPDAWGLLRASNTVPALVLRFEGNSPEALERIQSQMLTQLQRLNVSLANPS